MKFFIGKLLVIERNEEHRLTEDEANKLNKVLYKHDVIDENDKITIKGRELIEQSSMPLPESLEPYREAVANLLKSIYTDEAFKPEDERKTIVLTTNANFKKKEFQELWEKINLKTIYEVKFDTQKLVQDSKGRLDKDLQISDRTYEVTTGGLEDGTKEEMHDGTLMKVITRQNLKLNTEIYTKATYDIVGEIEA